MNYLAHSYLNETEEQLVGQFLNDYIRNRDRHLLPEGIQDGIRRHRAIDSFTDTHPAIIEAKKVFAPLTRLYAGAFVDVAMDYFLANDPKILSTTEWKAHSQATYATLRNYLYLFPENFKTVLHYMEKDDWLYNYRTDWGMKHSLQNVLNKAKYLDKSLPIFDAFLKEKPFLQSCSDAFFPELRATVVVLDFKP